ncbi:hypothetical protein DL93DRAFT_2173954 [Clavulina sp. PMI_390]|nr:hypothetical protein DL93DRAFT_2173954 [Clavulina sp. PMI_390]
MESDTSDENPSQTTSARVLLQTINLDVLVAIISWLDPLSILRLSNVCKTLRDAIDHGLLIWRRAFQGVIEQHCIAPRSFDHGSINDLKRLSLHPSRLSSAFQNPGQPLYGVITRCLLNYGPAIPSRMASKSNSTPKIKYLLPHLLPGGQ